MTERTWSRQPIGLGTEFRTSELTPHARLTYFTICNQLKVAPCGLLELQESRWALDAGLEVDQLNAALDELNDTGWIHLDRGTAELVISRHMRDDIQKSNSKIVKGIHTSFERIESPRLRQVVLDRITEIPGFPPPPGHRTRPIDPPTDRAIEGRMDRAIDRPIEGPMDTPGALSPEPSSSSSTYNSTGPSPTPDDDEPPPAATTTDPNNPDDRAHIACRLVGDHDFHQARLAGRITRSPTHYRDACRRTALATWLTDAQDLADTYPDWPPDELATFIIHGANAGALPAGPTTPDIDLRDAPITELENGAIVVDLDEARRRAGTG